MFRIFYICVLTLSSMVIFSCGNTTQTESQKPIDKKVKSDRALKVRTEKKAIQQRAITALNTIESSALPFVSEFNLDKSDSVIAQYLNNKGKSTALDSVFMIDDFEGHWPKNSELKRTYLYACKFITRLEYPNNNIDLLLYAVQGEIKDYKTYTMVYLVAVNHLTFELISNAHIGYCYLKKDRKQLREDYYSKGKIEIDEALNIQAWIKTKIDGERTLYNSKNGYVSDNGDVNSSKYRTILSRL